MSTGSYRYFMRGRAAEVRNLGDLLEVLPDLMLCNFWAGACGSTSGGRQQR